MAAGLYYVDWCPCMFGAVKSRNSHVLIIVQARDIAVHRLQPTSPPASELLLLLYAAGCSVAVWGAVCAHTTIVHHS